MKNNKNNNSKRANNNQFNDQKDRGNTRRPRQEKPEATPMAKALLEEYREEIRSFLTTSIDNREELARALFSVPGFPADAASIESAEVGVETYKVYCLERSVRLNRDDPSKLTRMSGTILYQKKAGKPAYMVSAFITPSGSGNVTVFTYGERGIVGRERWSSDRDGL